MTDLEILQLALDTFATAFLAGLFVGFLFTAVGKGEKIW